MPDSFVVGNGYRTYVPQSEFQAELVILPVVPNQHYKANAPALDPNGNLVLAKSDFVSEPTYNASSWVASGNATYVPLKTLALNPDLLISGPITRDGNGAATSAPVLWPDGTVGTYTADTVSSAFPGAVDAYHVTYGSPASKTYTQPAVTRDATGAVTNRPALTVA